MPTAFLGATGVGSSECATPESVTREVLPTAAAAALPTANFFSASRRENSIAICLPHPTEWNRLCRRKRGRVADFYLCRPVTGWQPCKQRRRCHRRSSLQV